MSETSLPTSFDPLRVVLDTNVVMALWHFGDPALARLRGFCSEPGVRLLCRSDSLGELRRVLAYAQFGIDPARAATILADYAARCESLPEPDEGALAEEIALPRCRDRDDQKFLAIAWLGRAGLLLTRDKLVLKLARKPPFRERMRIMTPERFEQELRTVSAAAAAAAGPGSA